MSAPIPRPGPPQPAPVPGPPAAPADAAGDAERTVAALEASVAELGELDGLPVGEHVSRYDALHGKLSEALAAIDGV